jgi:hypothetical protein
MSETSTTDMSEEARTRRAPPVASMVFFALLAVLGLLAVAWGSRPTEPPVPGTASAHLSWAKSYRDQAVAAQREADRHRALAERPGASPGQVLPAALLARCQRLATAAAELSSVANELADYHEEQARVLAPAAAQER